MAKKKDALSLRGAGHGTAEEGYISKSDSVLLFGDPHLSAEYSGTHKDYQENCRRVMLKILEHVREAREHGTVAVIFLGDVFGVKERNIRNHAFLYEVVVFFKELNNLCNNEVFSVRGNHDFGASGSFPDFALFEGLGMIRNPLWVDYHPEGEERQVRFHLVNFGAEDRELEMAHKDVNSDTSDVILAHNDFKIDGLTGWYGNNTIDLKRQTNFIGASLLISGHIHTPSGSFMPCTIGSVADIKLFYPGCPTRVSERYDDCYYVKFTVESGGASYDCPPFGLWTAEEEFFPKSEADIADLEGVDERKVRTEKLEEIIKLMQENQIFHGNVDDQITNYPEFSPVVKGIALDYLHKASAN